MSEDTTVKDLGLSEEFCEIFDALPMRRKQFWTEYLMGGCINKTHTALKVGYSPASARISAGSITNCPEGRRLMALYFDEIGITGTSLLAELHRMNNADICDYLPGEESLQKLKKKGIDTRQIKKFKRTKDSIELELYDRSKAIEHMAKIRKLYDDKNDNTVRIEVLIKQLEEQAAEIATRPDDVEAAMKDSNGSGS